MNRTEDPYAALSSSLFSAISSVFKIAEKETRAGEKTGVLTTKGPVVPTPEKGLIVSLKPAKLHDLRLYQGKYLQAEIYFPFKLRNGLLLSSLSKSIKKLGYSRIRGFKEARLTKDRSLRATIKGSCMHKKVDTVIRIVFVERYRYPHTGFMCYLKLVLPKIALNFFSPAEILKECRRIFLQLKRL